MRRGAAILLIFVFAFSFSYAEETEAESEIETKTETETESKAESEESEVETFVLNDKMFFVTAGPMLMVNTDDETKSSPSPVMFSLGFGYDFFQTQKVFAEVRGCFFTNYYLWDGENAQPAEVENRTATALSFMIDMTCGHIWTRGLNQFALSGGFGFLVRIGLLSSGVDSDDVGGEFDGESYSTAGDDVSSINSWFYSKANFLHPEISFSYMRSIPSYLGKCMVGCEFRTYFSLGSAIRGDFADGMIFDLALKVQF